MADIDSLVYLVKNSPEANDAACLKIIDPPSNMQDRTDHIENIEAAGSSKNKYYLPPAEPWRVTHTVGVTLDNTTHIIRANCFRISVEYLPKAIHHYDVGIFRIGREGNPSEENLAKEFKNTVDNVGIMKIVLEQNPQWSEDKKMNPVGLSYDGQASLYASKMLKLFPDSQQAEELGQQFTQEVAWPPESEKKYVVVIRQLKAIAIPSSHGKQLIPLLFCLTLFFFLILVAWRAYKEWASNDDDANAGVKALHALNNALSAFASWHQADDKPKWIMAKNKVFR